MLTPNEKRILCGARKVKPCYLWNKRSIARKKADKALEDLIFLAETDPKLVSYEKIVKLVESYLKHGRITTQERWVKRLPSSLDYEKKRPQKGKYWVKMGGVPRNGKGAPLKKTQLRRKTLFAYELLKVIYTELSEVSILGEHVNQVLTLKATKKGLKLSGINFKDWLRNKAQSLVKPKILVIN